MKFDHLIGISNTKENQNKIKRKAIRAIIIRDKKLLMVTNNKGDIKFPGGGVEGAESHDETLKREVMEETGYKVSIVVEKIGIVIERRQDHLDEDTIFEMDSHYYQCEITGEAQYQSLDDYEEAMDFKPKWVDISEAIELNQTVINNPNRNPWVERELYVLNQIKDYYS